MKKLNTHQLQASRMLAGGMPYAEVARKVGVTKRSLETWRAQPLFQDQVRRDTDELLANATREGIARKEMRVAVIQDLHARLLQIVEERSAAAVEASRQFAGIAAVPGATSGLLHKRLKSIGGGDNAQVVEEWWVDTDLVKEVRALHERMAKELGQEGGEVQAADPLANLLATFDRKNQEYEQDQETSSIQ